MDVFSHRIINNMGNPRLGRTIQYYRRTMEMTELSKALKTCRRCKKRKKIVMFGYCNKCVKEQGGLNVI